MNNRKLTQPSRAVADLWAGYLAANRRGGVQVDHDLRDRLMRSKDSSLADVAIKAQLLLGRDAGSGFADDDVERICRDVQSLCRRRIAAETPANCREANLKVLSIRQPWASLIAHGIKDIENRSWSTSYRGPLLVHAAAKADCALRNVEQFLGVELRAIATPRGGIIGMTNIVDCVATHASPWFSGPHGLVLSGSRELPFLSMKSFLRLRDAPASLLEHFGLGPAGPTIAGVIPPPE